MSAIPATSYTSRVLVDGTLALTVHIEPAHRLDAQKLFSGPGTAMALAALVTAHEKPTPAEPEKPPMGPLCKWAVMRCGEASFQTWIRPVYDRAMGGNGTGWGDVHPDVDFGGNYAEYASHCVKVLAEVTSRRELDTPEIAPRFKAQIMQPYGAWLSGRATS